MAAELKSRARTITAGDLEFVRRLIADPRKARALLGYRPTVFLPEGLRRLLAWYASRAETPEKLLEYERIRGWESPGEAASP